MKSFLFILALVLCCFTCAHSQESPSTSSYDAALASRLGADDYGMKVYYMALLKPGPNRNQDEATAAEIQKGHMQHISQMAASGKLVLAGPFLEPGDFRGIFIFNVATREEAEALTQSDPAVQSGRLEMVLIKWYGSAALIELMGIHERITNKNIGD